MKISEIIRLPVVRSSFEHDHYISHIYEIDSFYLKWEELEKAERIETKFYVHEVRSEIYVYSVYDDGRLVMLCFEYGEGRNKISERCIVNISAYCEMVMFLMSFYCWQECDTKTLDADINGWRFESYLVAAVDKEIGNG